MGRGCSIQIALDSCNGYLRRPLLWKSELARGYAAESNALQAVCIRQCKARMVAVCQFLLMLPGQSTATDDGADCVEHIAGGQVVALRYLCLSRRFGMPLRLHHAVASQT